MLSMLQTAKCRNINGYQYIPSDPFLPGAVLCVRKWFDCTCIIFQQLG